MAKKQTKKKQESKYIIDGISYTSKTLYEFHKECMDAQKNGLIKSYNIPDRLSSKSRYSTYKPIIDGIEFDSLMEANYYLHLLKQKKSEVIKGFERQVSFELQPRFKKEGKTYRQILSHYYTGVSFAQMTSPVWKIETEKTTAAPV